MGSWNAVVIGVGAHHNVDLSSDANRLFKKFVDDLRTAGHTVSHASFTYGARDTAKNVSGSYENTGTTFRDESEA